MVEYGTTGPFPTDMLTYASEGGGGSTKGNKSFSATSLSFESMFKNTAEQYGFDLHPPAENDYDIYKR